jgi:hypothetical protein
MKRVFIDRPIAASSWGKLLAALEKEALQRDCHTVRLETGIHQHAAVALYTRNGYQTRSAFAPYQPDPLSLFMEKLLLPIFVQQRYKRLQLAGFRPAPPDQPGRQPAPLFGQRPGGYLLMAGHTLQHTARDQRQSGAGNDAGQHPVVDSISWIRPGCSSAWNQLSKWRR